MIRALLIFGLLTLGFAAEATAQTRTSTGVEFEADRLDAELGDWEAGARPVEGFGLPARDTSKPPAAPGGARFDAVPAAPTAPPRSPSPSVATVERTVDARMLADGEKMREHGKVMLYAGIGAGVLGTVLGISGYSRAASNSGSESTNGLLVLSGLGLGGVGAAGMIAGSIMLHRGGKKIDRARKSVSVSSLGPARLPGGGAGLVVAGAF